MEIGLAKCFKDRVSTFLGEQEHVPAVTLMSLLMMDVTLKAENLVEIKCRTF